MGYVFKEKITFREYDEFIKNYDYLPFMQENNWAKAKEYANYIIVGVMDNNKLCATAQILIKKKKRDNLFYIPNGYLLDFKNEELVNFMTKNIIALAHKYHAYVVDLYPYITNKNKAYNKIHDNLISNNYQWDDNYFDNSKNVLISLLQNDKKITKTELKKKYDQSDFYIKRGIAFEQSTNLEDIKRLDNLIDNEYFDDDLVGKMLCLFEDRIKMFFVKIDLVFYKNFLKDNNASLEDINKIEELILALGETTDLGCALVIFPYNKKNRVCEVIYNNIKDLGIDLQIEQGLIYQILLEAHNKNCTYVKISNPDLNVDFYTTNYNATNIKYIGHYYLVINKLLYFLNKEIKIKKRKSSN